MFTLNLVYQATVVGLSPLQLVLVGTVLEAVCFLAEVPTGLVADLYSRRLSIVIGFALVGAGFTVEASMPRFAAVLVAQVLWGVGATFLSGAIEAWITDEVGAARVAAVFVRGTQVGLVGQMLGIVAAGALGLVWLRLPIFVGAAGMLALAGTLAALMPERGFRGPASRRREQPGDSDQPGQPADLAQPAERVRVGFAQMADQVRDGLALARTRPLVRTLMWVSLIDGLASEAFDRLWTVYLLHGFGLPGLFGTSGPALWFALISLVGAVVALVGTGLLTKLSPRTLTQHHPARLLAALAGVQVLATVVFAVAGQFWLALATLWLRQATTVIAAPVRSAWMNRQLDSSARATVLSMESQLNAVGQVAGGPALGAVGSSVSVRAALLCSAAVFTPTVALYGRTRPMPATRRGDVPEPG
jgi:DHA3 family tetracycline resistance protein-like MFS transporter